MHSPLGADQKLREVRRRERLGLAEKEIATSTHLAANGDYRLEPVVLRDQVGVIPVLLEQVDYSSPGVLGQELDEHRRQAARKKPVHTAQDSRLVALDIDLDQVDRS